MLTVASDRAKAVSLGYCVIRDLEINNFRCFRSVSLTDLGRVNVIVGENGSGKTTLLESLFLVGGNTADLTLRIRSQRGMGEQIAIGADRRLMEQIWADLFHDSEMSRSVRISVTDSEGPSRSVTIRRSNGNGMQSLLPLSMDGKPAALVVPIEIIWKAGDEVAQADIKLTSDGLMQGLVGKLSTLPLLYFYSTVATAAPSETASRFSELSKINRDEAFVKSIHDLYPMVRQLSVETNAGNAMLYAKVHGASVKLPLAVVSQGINKVVQLLLGIEVSAQGIVLVDELESGLYYSQFPKIWLALFSAARRAQAQLFITTHSRECLSALSDVLRADESEFRLIRAERKDNENTLRVFSGKQFNAALSQEIEVR